MTMPIRPYKNYPFTIHEFRHYWKMHNDCTRIKTMEDFHKIMEVVVFRKTLISYSTMYIPIVMSSKVEDVVSSIDDDYDLVATLLKIINNENKFTGDFIYNSFKRLLCHIVTYTETQRQDFFVSLAVRMICSIRDEDVDERELYDMVCMFAEMTEYDSSDIGMLLHFLGHYRYADRTINKFKLVHGNKMRMDA